MQAVTTAEREFFRALNPLIEPWARAGCVSPSRWPFGVVVIETTGRRSGESRSNPVLAMLVEGHLIIGTARGQRSDWFQNLQASPQVRYWLDGERHDALALAFVPQSDGPAVQGLPPLVQDAIATLTPAVDAFGCRFAVLVPQKDVSTRHESGRPIPE